MFSGKNIALLCCRTLSPHKLCRGLHMMKSTEQLQTVSFKTGLGFLLVLLTYNYRSSYIEICDNLEEKLEKYWSRFSERSKARSILDLVGKKADYTVLRLLQVGMQHVEGQLDKIRADLSRQMLVSWGGQEPNRAGAQQVLLANYGLPPEALLQKSDEDEDGGGRPGGQQREASTAGGVRPGNCREPRAMPNSYGGRTIRTFSSGVGATFSRGPPQPLMSSTNRADHAPVGGSGPTAAAHQQYHGLLHPAILSADGTDLPKFNPLLLSAGAAGATTSSYPPLFPKTVLAPNFSYSSTTHDGNGSPAVNHSFSPGKPPTHSSSHGSPAATASLVIKGGEPDSHEQQQPMQLLLTLQPQFTPQPPKNPRTSKSEGGAKRRPASASAGGK